MDPSSGNPNTRLHDDSAMRLVKTRVKYTRKQAIPAAENYNYSGVLHHLVLDATTSDREQLCPSIRATFP
jgi:hypothetical protein